MAQVAIQTARVALGTAEEADLKASRALSILDGTVPRAQRAAIADSLRGITVAPFNRRVAASATASTETAARAAASRVNIFSQGPLRIYGKCFVNNANPANPNVRGELYVETTVGGVIYSSDGSDSGNGFITPSTEESNRRINDTGSSAGEGNPGTLNITDAKNGGFQVVAPGLAITGSSFVGTKVGSPPAGNGVFGSGNACIFAGIINAY